MTSCNNKVNFNTIKKEEEYFQKAFEILYILLIDVKYAKLPFWPKKLRLKILI